MNKLEISRVNKFDENWHSNTLYEDWNVRAILKAQNDWITKINAVSQIRKKLVSDVGNDGDQWMIIENTNTDEDELYMRNAGMLIMWKLQDSVQFSELFERIEQHGILVV